MSVRRDIRAIGLAAVTAAGLVWPAHAERRVVAADSNLQTVLDQAAAGDVIVLQAGTHRGPITIARTITLAAEQGAVVAGSGQGSVITVLAPNTIVSGLTVRGSGMNLEAMDAGIFVARSAAGAVVEGNRLEGNLYGIYLHGAADAVARNNTIVGLQQTRMNDAGNGISVWNAARATIAGNDVRFGRDGIFINTSNHNTISGNRFQNLRFAVHYMYAHDGTIVGNISTGNTIGFALMYSQKLTIRNNLSERDRDHGLLLNYVNGSQIAGNAVRGGLLPQWRWLAPRGADHEHMPPAGAPEQTAASDGLRPAPEKCVFIYNANNNQFRDNWFEGCEIGIHFTAGSERNQIAGNAFIGNRTQVKYVGTRFLDWSKDGRGNYWSDNPGFDLNGDGIADTAYRPNDLVDRVLWMAPQAKVLMNSPAVQVIRWAQAQFPALLPGGVVDGHPLVAPPARPAVLQDAP